MINNILIDKIYQEDRRSIARAISIIESNNSLTSEYLKEIFKKVGNAYRIGITGPPGSGKSTITNQLTKYFRKQNKKVGIIAVDPTSPFTGGALLGDRVRMTDIGMDSGVFIRSMATRGSLGGLSKKAIDAADPGDTINVAAGTYNEAIAVNKALNLVGAGDDVTIIDGTGLSVTNLFKASGLSSGTLNISGFTFLDDPTPDADMTYLVSFSGCQDPAIINFHNNTL